MDATTLALVAALIFLAATLYSSVGHAGASGYLAIMALFSLAPETMRPTALVLNILVASVATWRFVGAGQINWRLLTPAAATSVPAAFIGGALHLPGETYRIILGAVLLLSAARLLWPKEIAALRDPAPPNLWALALVGAGIGLLSGLVGVGGGIFLSPIILFLGWERPRPTSGVAAAFILANSLAGLAGNWSSVGALPAELPYFLGAALLGGLLGSHFGVARLAPRQILTALALVLLVAGAKLLFT
jgi:hypothetical protein